ncbi:hypothetical protein E2K80_05755 [Rhodophyticola sp. CCM32]|uniref:hypothetical protein n=1 Tax=Rhodophyticola sp. CCM32 TaxID=2916397 RepID=UPI00107F9DA7|nr:hypothetical protein [Rhodophyticola sp. CCM32]QBY00303.1 hypothetical protein E2K80_05755 [Rhodophyticola sp. CCM32]
MKGLYASAALLGPLLGLAAAPCQAEPWACAFTVECIAGEACLAAAYEVDILAADHEGRLFLSSIVADTPATRLTAEKARPASYAGISGDGLAEMITIRADSTARMTAHMFDGPAMAITYFGTCEAL